MSPTLPPFDQVNRAWVYSGNDRQRVGWDAKAQCFTNMNDLFLRKFVPRLIFPTEINEAGFPLMFRIVRNSQPFKVLGSVIKFVAVNVVHRQVRFISGHKSSCNQSMSKYFNPFAAPHAGYNVITAFANVWRQLLGWNLAYKCLNFAKSSPRHFYGIWRTPNGTVRVNQPNNAFVFNWYRVHGVNMIAGHQ